jgi:hypothetical protein
VAKRRSFRDKLGKIIVEISVGDLKNSTCYRSTPTSSVTARIACSLEGIGSSREMHFAIYIRDAFRATGRDGNRLRTPLKHSTTGEAQTNIGSLFFWVAD